MTEHHLDDTVTHAYWDREVDVRLEVESGDVVVVECAEPIGQVTPTWTDDDFAGADPSLAHALSGAIYVKGACSGDTLVIDILKMEHKGWGWSGLIPDFGLLADDFDSAHLHHWELEGSICRFADGIEVPAEPFPGVIGVAHARAAASTHFHRARTVATSTRGISWPARLRGSRFTPTVHCSRSAIVIPLKETERCAGPVWSRP